MRTIYRLFGRSPFGPLVEHTRRVHETVKGVRPLFEAYLSENWDRCEELHEEISKLEHRADQQKNEIRDHLPKTMFLPVSRGDILRYLHEQDSIADAAEDLAVMLTMRPRPTPDRLEAPILELVNQVILTSEVLVGVASEITELFEASFGGPEADRVREIVSVLNDQEWEADKQQRRVARALVQEEDGLDPVAIFLWMHTLEVLGEIANHAENTGDRLRVMMAR